MEKNSARKLLQTQTGGVLIYLFLFFCSKNLEHKTLLESQKSFWREYMEMVF